MDYSYCKFRHIIWDWNGTLLDDVSLSVNVMNNILASHGMPLVSARQYTEVFCFPVVEYYRKLGFDFSICPFEEISHSFVTEYNRCLSSCSLHNDAVFVLKSFSNSGITQSILSASQQSFLTMAVDHFKIGRFFTTLVGLDNCNAASKLNIGKEFASSLDCSPSEVLLIGDTVHDFEVAQAAGCSCILVSCGHQCQEKLTSCRVPVAASLADILKITGLPAAQPSSYISIPSLLGFAQ